MPKHVISSTLSEPLEWENSHLVEGGVDGVEKLKEDDGGPILVELWLGPLRSNDESEDLLRRVLGERLGLPPAELRFRRGERGKPELAGEEIAFNLSHSGGLALIGVAENGAVGVDLEQVRALRRLDLLAKGTLTGAELDSLRRLDDEGEQAHWFLRRWTAKEAVAKAFGAGLALEPQRLEVKVVDGERALVAIAPSSEGAMPAGAEPVEVRWLEPADGFVGAVAVLP